VDVSIDNLSAKFTAIVPSKIMSEAPKLQARSISPNLKPTIAWMEEFSVFMFRAHLSKVWFHVGHSTRVGVQDTTVVDAPIRLHTFQPSVGAFADLT
jgi:hypothetical protein